MKPSNVIVATIGGERSTAVALRDRLERSWGGRTPLDVRDVDERDLTESDLSSVDGAVLVVEHGSKRAEILPRLAALEEAGVAILALMDDPPRDGNPFVFAGAHVEWGDHRDATIVAKLEGMLVRQGEVRRLRREVAVAQRFHGGLEGEIARMHEELQLAAMVQREFLPRELPTLHGIEFAALWRPAHYVSGDIYDVARLDDDHVAMFIADAVGHGVPAALMTMVIARSLVTKRMDGQTYELVEPSEVLANLNRALIRKQGNTTRFATAAYAIVDCRSRTMRVAGAGHPPPLLMRAGGTSEELSTSGGLLGVFDDETYDQIEVEFGAGDRLLFYSDGFEQAFPKESGGVYDRRLPTTRYRSEFEALAAEPTPTRMIETISRRLDDQVGSLHQADDLTLICLQAGPLIQSALRASISLASALTT